MYSSDYEKGPRETVHGARFYRRVFFLPYTINPEPGFNNTDFCGLFAINFFDIPSYNPYSFSKKQVFIPNKVG